MDPLARIAGHNVKLGEGGIREIEFLAQTLQLVWGGRRSSIARCPRRWVHCACWFAPATCRAVPRANWAAAYRFLRRVEHTPADDRRPPSARAAAAARRTRARFATFMGYNEAGEFAAQLLHHLHQVRARYVEVFELVPALLAPAEGGLELDFQRCRRRSGSHRHDAKRALGFGNPGRIVTAVRAGWRAGHARALRSARARELLAQLLPRVPGRAGPPASARHGVQPVRRIPGASARRRAASMRCSSVIQA